jgi:DNA polymerase
MFIGEAPGADEDEQGEPFVGRSGQLLTNMIKAMGLRREDVYIANIIKCRPPSNRTPERDECDTCSPFLMRQIEAIRPKALVALGAVAAKSLLAINAPMSELRGRWYDFRGTKLASDVPPGFSSGILARKETWKDLQMVMKEMGLPLPEKASE